MCPPPPTHTPSLELTTSRRLAPLAHAVSLSTPFPPSRMQWFMQGFGGAVRARHLAFIPKSVSRLHALMGPWTLLAVTAAAVLGFVKVFSGLTAHALVPASALLLAVAVAFVTVLTKVARGPAAKKAQ